MHEDVGGGAEVVGLPRGLDDDGVVAARQIAIADFDVRAVVRVDAVAVGNVKTIAHSDMVHKNVAATKQMQSPERSVAEGDVADLQVCAGGEDKHFGPPQREEPPFARRIVAGHERQRSSSDAAGAGDAQIGRVGGGQDRVSAVIGAVGANEQLGMAGEVKVDVAAQFQRPDQVTMAAGHENFRAVTRRSRGIDGALNGRRVQGDAVAHRAEFENVKYIRVPRPQRNYQSKREEHRDGDFWQCSHFTMTSQTLDRRDLPAGPSMSSTTT